jgi:hypothetical protein
MNILKSSHLSLGIVLCLGIGIMANVYPGKVSSAAEGITETQDVRSLDRRISLLEQRLYSIESSISRMQSEVSLRSPVPQSSARDQEINLIRGEMQALQLRVSEIECGLLKLDERTTVSARDDNRKRAGGKPADPCRLDPATPLRLSTRQ